MPVKSLRHLTNNPGDRSLRRQCSPSVTSCANPELDYKNIVKVPAADVLPAVSVAKTSMRFSPRPVP